MKKIQIEITRIIKTSVTRTIDIEVEDDFTRFTNEMIDDMMNDEFDSCGFNEEDILDNSELDIDWEGSPILSSNGSPMGSIFVYDDKHDVIQRYTN